MHTEISVTQNTKGWIFFDADCRPCVRSVEIMQPILRRLRLESIPLQTPGAETRLGVGTEELRARLHLLTANGKTFAGADALIEIARGNPWSRPLASIATLPRILPLLRRGYDCVAAHRPCPGGACERTPRHGVVAWLPLALLPTVAVLFRQHMAAWQFMWAMAIALYAGCKWLTYRHAVATGVRFTTSRAAGYLFAWVGMEPAAFADASGPAPKVLVPALLVATVRTFLGAALIWFGVRHTTPPIVAGWLGMIGLILLLHFGLFQILALAWQRAGVPVRPLMQAPLIATSLGEFWSVRWNTGFHALVHKFAFRPLLRHIGARPSLLAVFLISGVIHELVITIPARGGYGLPTIYFALQGLGIMFERSSFGKASGLATGIRGRTFALLLAAAPAFWLFPPIFVQHVILPMLHAIGATPNTP